MRTVANVCALALLTCVMLGACGASVRASSPAAMAVTSPVHTEEEAPFQAYETQRTFRASARGGGPPDDVRMPGLFMARTRTRIEDLQHRVQIEVALANLSADALDTMAARGRAILASAQWAARDGVITDREHEQVEMLLTDTVRETFGAVPIHRAWPGGPPYWH